MSFTQLHNWNTDYGNNHERDAEEYRSQWAPEPESLSQHGVLEEYRFKVRPLQTQAQRDFNEALKK